MSNKSSSNENAGKGGTGVIVGSGVTIDGLPGNATPEQIAEHQKKVKEALGGKTVDEFLRDLMKGLR